MLAIICQAFVQWLTASTPRPVQWPPEMWSLFQVACRVHGIAPRLHAALGEGDWLPAAQRQWLAEQYALNQQRLLKMQTEQRAIVSLFADHKTPILPLKGAALAVLVYEDPALRPMADLDFLVRPADLAHSLALLAQLDYQLEEINWKHAEFIKADNRVVVRRDGEHPHNPRKVDLHLYCREMFGGPRVDLTEPLWSTARMTVQDGRPTYWPHLEMLWRHVVVHSGNNVWNGNLRLINLIDILTLAARLPDLPLPPSDEVRYGYLALALCERYFPGRLPNSWSKGVSTHVPNSVQRWVQTIDLVNSSHLKEKPSRSFLTKWFTLHRGRPRAVGQALRFLLLPDRQALIWERGRTRHRLPALWLKHLGQKARLALKLLRPSP